MKRTDVYQPVIDVVRVRPIRPDDEPMMVAFHLGLSPDSVYSRYFNVFKLARRTAHARLQGVCHPDSLRDTVLLAEVVSGHRNPEIAGVGRVSGDEATNAGEVALVVGDAFQRRGLGKELLLALILAARARRYERVWALMLRGNLAMQHLCASAGMRTVEPFASDAGAGSDVTMAMEL